MCKASRLFSPIKVCREDYQKAFGSEQCAQRPPHPSLALAGCTGYKGSTDSPTRTCEAEVACVLSPPDVPIHLTIHADYHSGFFAKLHSTLNQIEVAQALGFRPLVQWSRCTHHFWASNEHWMVDHYYSANHGSNIFEYFFEPVGRASPDDVIVQLSRRQAQHLHHGSLEGYRGRSIFAYYYGRYRSKHDRAGVRFDESWFLDQRTRAAKVIAEHIRFRPHMIEAAITAAADLGLADNWKNVIGIHVRSTDKHTSQAVQAESYYKYLDAYIKARPDAIIFVATDAAASLELIIRRYGRERVKSQANVLRRPGNAFLDRSLPAYEKGYQVCLDALLLSRCDVLLMSSSHVAEFAVYFSPGLRLHRKSWHLEYQRGYATLGDKMTPVDVRTPDAPYGIVEPEFFKLLDD